MWPLQTAGLTTACGLVSEMLSQSYKAPEFGSFVQCFVPSPGAKGFQATFRLAQRGVIGQSAA